MLMAAVIKWLEERLMLIAALKRCLNFNFSSSYDLELVESSGLLVYFRNSEI